MLRSAHSRGFTLIEIIIATGIIMLAVTSLFLVITAAFRALGESRARITARSLANEKIELFKNLPYESVGTVGGIPSGTVAQTESAFRNGLTYNIRTTVVYIDDAFDNQAPQDMAPNDYKRARVEVSWGGIFASLSPVVLLADISPRGMETTTGGGTLMLTVFDAYGEAVNGASAHIVNNEATPVIDFNITTDDSGTIVLPGSPACNSCYQITVTKNGYSTDRTYTTSEVANPNLPPATVIESEVTPLSFAIDKTSDLTVQTTLGRDNNFSVLPQAGFHIRSAKTIGADTLGQSVYKTDADYTTDSQGRKTFAGLEWDNYTLVKTETAYDLSGNNPLQPVSLPPGVSLTAYLAYNSHTANSLLLTTIDAGGLAVASVSANLKKSGYDKTLLTGRNQDPDFGQAFFNNLTSGSYDLIASLSGYQTATASVSINGQTAQTMLMNLTDLIFQQ